MCQQAYTEVDVLDTGFVGVRDIRMAVANLLYDPDWIHSDHWILWLMDLHSDVKMPKEAAIQVLMCTCAYYLERVKRPLPARYYFNILQIPLTSTMDEVKRAYLKLSQQWYPSEEEVVSKAQAAKDIKFLTDVQNAALEFLVVTRRRKTALK